MDQLLEQLKDASRDGDVSAFNAAIVRYLLDLANGSNYQKVAKDAIGVATDLLGI